MAYGAVLELSHFATITLRLFLVKPVPGPETTLIFLPSRKTVRQETGSLNGVLGVVGRIDHGLLSTDRYRSGPFVVATTRQVWVASEITATMCAPKGLLDRSCPTIQRSFGDETKVPNRASSVSLRLGGSRPTTRPVEP